MKKFKINKLFTFSLGLILGIVFSIPIYNFVRPISIYDVPECKNFIGHNPNLQFISEPTGKNKTFICFSSTMDQDDKFYVFIGEKNGIFKNQTSIHYSYPIDGNMFIRPENNTPNPTPIQWSNHDGLSDLIYYGIVPHNVKSVTIDGKEANLKDFSFTYLDNKDNSKKYDVKIKFYYLITEDTYGEQSKSASIEILYNNWGELWAL